MIDYFQFIDTKKLDERIATERFPFRQNLFWDYPIENIDLKKNQLLIAQASACASNSTKER